MSTANVDVIWDGGMCYQVVNDPSPRRTNRSQAELVAWLLDTDDYEVVATKFTRTTKGNREKIVADPEALAYLRRAANTRGSTTIRRLRQILADVFPAPLPAEVNDFLEQVAGGNSEYDAISVRAADLLEKYTHNRVPTPNVPA